MPGKGKGIKFAGPKGKLQNIDQIVQSIRDCRRAYAELSDREFATWYEKHQKVPERRVLAILEALKSNNGGVA